MPRKEKIRTPKRDPMEKRMENLEEVLDQVNVWLDQIEPVLERLALRFPPPADNGDWSAMGETSGEVSDRVDGKIQPWDMLRSFFRTSMGASHLNLSTSAIIFFSIIGPSYIFFPVSSDHQKWEGLARVLPHGWSGTHVVPIVLLHYSKLNAEGDDRCFASFLWTNILWKFRWDAGQAATRNWNCAKISTIQAHCQPSRRVVPLCVMASFIEGLRTDIGQEVLIFQPSTLQEAMVLARCQEEKLNRLQE